MSMIYVNTPQGRGTVWGIDRNEVLVEHDFMYLVGYPLDQVEGVDADEEQAGKAAK